MLVYECKTVYDALATFLNVELMSFGARTKAKRNMQALQPVIDLFNEEVKSKDEEKIKTIMSSEVEVNLDTFREDELEYCNLTELGREVFIKVGLYTPKPPLSVAILKKPVIVEEKEESSVLTN